MATSGLRADAARESAPSRLEDGTRHGALLAGTALGVCGLAAMLAARAPLGVSIVAVLLFAAPHNWMEARFFLTRMPARWGALRPFFSLGLLGVPVLAVSYASIPRLASWGAWADEGWLVAAALWNTALVGWVLALALLRSQAPPRRDWGWLAPLALALLAPAWLWPSHWALSLVYVHPLIALWFLDRELLRQRPGWRTAYHAVLVAAIALWGVIVWRLSGSTPLLGDDPVSERITRHAGAALLPGVSSRLLVATHVYLELLHYGVWLLAIPSLALRDAPWRLGDIPLRLRSRAFRAGVAATLALGALLVLAFWAGFLTDYARTRDLYFTIAMLHVLAEAPFLLRAL